jgi:acyl-CoA reductase-like NAD-dependent aldehyde dehydrogenase
MIDLFIDGQACAASSGATFERRTPDGQAVACTAAAASLADAERACLAAERGFALWSRTGPGERRAVLLRAAELMERHLDDFTRLMALEIGAAQG